MSTHNLCFKQIFEKYQNFLPENFQFLEVKFSIHLNKHVFVMNGIQPDTSWRNKLYQFEQQHAKLVSRG